MLTTWIDGWIDPLSILTDPIPIPDSISCGYFIFSPLQLTFLITHISKLCEDVVAYIVWRAFSDFGRQGADKDEWKIRTFSNSFVSGHMETHANTYFQIV
jgi:hypothetical protein